MAAINLANVKQTFDGLQSFPIKYGSGDSFEIKMWDNYGTWHTPYFGEEYLEGYYKENQRYHIVLDFPDNIRKVVGSGSLVIHLELDTREEEGWHEDIEYAEGAKRLKEYKLFTDFKTWADAEATCQTEGGHLASILTLEDCRGRYLILLGNFSGSG